MRADATEPINRHKRIRSGDFRANGHWRMVRHMKDDSRNPQARNRAENRADLARVLAALALLAWLSSWDGNDGDAARSDLARSAVTEAY